MRAEDSTPPRNSSRDLYEPLIERDLDSIELAVERFLETQSEVDLWVAIARFAVLAYAPSQHAKRAVVACRSALVIRDECGSRWRDLLVECARYAAESRQPWSEPPILEPPAVDLDAATDRAELIAAIAAKDRLRAERWLSARLHDCEDDLRSLAKGDALLMLETALSLEPHLGAKGRFALLRMPIHELLGEPEESGPFDALLSNAIAARGAVEAVSPLLAVTLGRPIVAGPSPEWPFEPYHLARDFAQTLLAHDAARRLPIRRDEFLAAVHHNLAHGESFETWSFA